MPWYSSCFFFCVCVCVCVFAVGIFWDICPTTDYATDTERVYSLTFKGTVKWSLQSATPRRHPYYRTCTYYLYGQLMDRESVPCSVRSHKLYAVRHYRTVACNWELVNVAADTAPFGHDVLSDNLQVIIASMLACIDARKHVLSSIGGIYCSCN